MYREIEHSRTAYQSSSKGKGQFRLRDYWVELVTLLAILSGAFLVIEPIPLGLISTLLGAAITRMTAFLGAWLASSVERITLANYTGGVVILLAGAFILKRIHRRIFSSLRYSAVQCPHCSGALGRIHRTRLDHLLGTLLHVRLRRYSCRGCGWAGLRVG